MTSSQRAPSPPFKEWVLDELDEDTLVRILTEPKNAIVKQYKKLFSYDKVKPSDASITSDNAVKSGWGRQESDN